jgi:FkbM family methyltransferase
MSKDLIGEYIESPLPFENEINQYFNKSDHLIIFEVGSCEGEDSIRLRRKYPKAKIYTFEALPNNIRKIKDNFKKYSAQNMNLFQLALSHKDGKATFYVSSGHPEDRPKDDGWDYGNKSSSLLKPKKTKKIHGWLKFKDKIKVKTRRLDSFCAEHSIDKIDFAFIDVQGAELMVLEGAGELIENIGMVWLEVEVVELYKRQPLKNDVERFMEKHGFKCIKSTIDDISGDQLYINNKLKKKPL